MEAVARQFANKQKVLIVRDGWFSFRWSQILMPTPASAAAPWSEGPAKQGEGPQAPWAPVPGRGSGRRHPRRDGPKVVFAPHVETASGIILSDDYIRTVSAAARGGRAVRARLPSPPAPCGWTCRPPAWTCSYAAPAKGWSSSPCCAMVMLMQRAPGHRHGTTATASPAT